MRWCIMSSQNSAQDDKPTNTHDGGKAGGAGGQGHLLIIGGSEDRQGPMPVLTRFLELAGGPQQPIVVITAASEAPQDVFALYKAAFTDLGVTRLTHVHLDSPKEAASDKLLAPMREAMGIFMTGGAQKRLMEMLRETLLLDEMCRAYLERGACIAGTSAGASAMSRLMLAGGHADLEPEKGAITLESGLGLVSHIVVDQHFAERKRLPRLLSIIAEHPDQYGIGIDEDTGLAICPGEGIEVVGNGGVTVVDGRYMLSNIAEIEKHASPRLIDVRLHVLPSGTRFSAAATDGPELPPEQFKAFFNALIERDQ